MENQTYSIPKVYTDMIGTKQTLEGHVLNFTEQIKPTEFEIHDVRFGEGFIMEGRQRKHPTIEYLIYKVGMTKKQWTKPFACTDIVFAFVKSEE